MTMQLDGYEKYAACAARELDKQGGCPKEENIVTRLSARVGMAMNTLMDASTSHIAEMMVKGSNMGITEMLKLLNNYETQNEGSEAVHLAKQVVHFEEENLERLKEYL